MKTYLRLPILLIILFGMSLSSTAQTNQGIYRTTFSAEGRTLIVELLDDDLAHFEISLTPPTDAPIWTSPMVAKTDYTGPSSVEFLNENELITPEMRLQIDETSLCVTVTDLTRDPELVLTTICPLLDEDDDTVKGLTFAQEGTTDIYGLGEQFRRRGGTDGNWMGDRRLMPNQFGNGLASFNGGNVGNAQFPIMYALGAETENYAVFVDHVYQQFWAFNNDPFVMQTKNTPLRWYLLTGSDLSNLRGDYMELTGTPPVPPKQMFGLWVSEFGYEDWNELTNVLESLREANFPLDGFVLDLQWFGGISRNSQMGSLAWDEENFPDPAEFIAQLRETYGIGIMTIEEPYVTKTARGYEEAAAEGVLVGQCEDCEPISMTSWWGSGSMVDWSDPDDSAWWHDQRRQHLIDEGVIGHWTDLGEPEDYGWTAWYYGFPEVDLHEHESIHNLYSLMWSQSIRDGYQRNGVERRPFILSRSGTSGIQRFGTAMWSGDIAANMPSLTEQMNVQMHMSLSGMDYFGSDVGGFFRDKFDPVLGMDRMYSVWLANSALLDVPLRPHAMNTRNQYQTAPSLVGDVPSNLANVRTRYELSPYLYTLAHLAYRTGEAVYPPLVYHFQDDPNVRTLGSQKMIGAQMMMATITDYDTATTDVYLPEGGWFNFYTGEYIEGTGETITVPSIVDEILQAPLFVRDGAVIPVMHVDDQTLNMLGQRLDGSTDNTVIFNVYHAAENGSFTLIEDDGETIAYQSGEVRETTITHEAEGDTLTISVSAAEGSYTGADDERNVEIHLFSPDRSVGRVLLNGEPLTEIESDDAEQGWMRDESGAVVVKSGIVPVETELVFTFEPLETVMEENRSLLLTHYMPWYQAPNISGSWGWHWTMNHFDPDQVDENGRPQIASQFTPLTGAYDSQDDAVLEYQVLLMKLSGIDGVIVDWYGTAHYNDYAMLNAATGKLFEYATRAGLRFVICYEDRTVLAMVNGGRLNTETALEQGKNDLIYAAEQWFGSDAYVKYQGQPLVFVFGPLYFRQASHWTDIFAEIEPKPALVTLNENLSFVALTGYPWPPMDLSGGATLNPAVLQGYLDLFYRNAQRNDYMVGSAFPGFHDIYEEADVRSSYGYLDAQDGQTLRDTLETALAQNPDIVQLVTWNDYGEGTTIEPTDEYGYQYLEIIQDTRRQIDSSFEVSAEQLQMPLRLFQLRRAYAGDDEVNAQLDRAFEAMIAGNFAEAETILAEHPL